jgi:hypothetical protein
MTEERKHAILLATVILTARKLQPLLEEDDRAGKPNMATEFWAQTYTKKSMERAAHILDLIDEKWPGLPDSADETPVSSAQK